MAEIVGNKTIEKDAALILAEEKKETALILAEEKKETKVINTQKTQGTGVITTSGVLKVLEVQKEADLEKATLQAKHHQAMTSLTGKEKIQLKDAVKAATTHKINLEEIKKTVSDLSKLKNLINQGQEAIDRIFKRFEIADTKTGVNRNVAQEVQNAFIQAITEFGDLTAKLKSEEVALLAEIETKRETFKQNSKNTTAQFKAADELKVLENELENLRAFSALKTSEFIKTKTEIATKYRAELGDKGFQARLAVIEGVGSSAAEKHLTTLGESENPTPHLPPNQDNNNGSDGHVVTPEDVSPNFDDSDDKQGPVAS